METEKNNEETTDIWTEILGDIKNKETTTNKEQNSENVDTEFNKPENFMMSYVKKIIQGLEEGIHQKDAEKTSEEEEEDLLDKCETCSPETQSNQSQNVYFNSATLRRSFRVKKSSASCESTPVVNRRSLQRNCQRKLSTGSNSSERLKLKALNSDGVSETDSSESIEKSSVKNDVGSRRGSISERLFNSETKASLAKTAKIRSLDHSLDDDHTWMSNLRSSSKDRDIPDKSKLKTVDKPVVPPKPNLKATEEIKKVEVKDKDKRKRRKSNLKKVLDQSLVLSTVADATVKSNNGVVKNAKLAVGSPFRSSVRLKKRWLKNVKTISYDIVQYIAWNKKHCGFFSCDEKVLFRDLAVLLRDKIDQVSFIFIYIHLLLPYVTLWWP